MEVLQRKAQKSFNGRYLAEAPGRQLQDAITVVQPYGAPSSGPTTTQPSAIVQRPLTKKFDFSFPLATDIIANNNPGHLPGAYNNSLNEGENSFLHSESDEVRTIPETEIANYLDTFEASLKEKLQESCPWIAFENEKMDVRQLAAKAHLDPLMAKVLLQAILCGITIECRNQELLDVARQLQRQSIRNKGQASQYRKQITELEQDAVRKNSTINRLLLLSNKSTNLIQQSIEVTETPQVPRVPSKAKKGTKIHPHLVPDEDSSSDSNPSSSEPDRHPRTKKSHKSYDDQARRKPIADLLRLSDGKSPTFEAWKMLMQVKFDTNHSHFPSERYKVLYILSCMEGKALGILSPRVKEDAPVSIRIVKGVFKFLEDIFEDWHRYTKACLDLGRLYLKEGGDYHIFYTKFAQLLVLAEIDQSEYKELLVNRLPPSIILHISRLEDDKNVSFEEFETEVSAWTNSVGKLV